MSCIGVAGSESVGRIRSWVRDAFRALCRMALPKPLVRALLRIPFSRFHGSASWLLRGDVLVVYRGARVWVNPGTVQGYYLYLFDQYAAEELDLLRGLCRGAKLFADVGANTGIMSLALAAECATVDIIAFEPAAAAIAGFHRNLAENADLASRIQFVETAVGREDGTARFEPSAEQENPEVGRLVVGSRGGHDVNIRSLDSFFSGRRGPDVIKIDVEGAELDVLDGMGELMKRKPPAAMLVEVHGTYFGDAAENFCREVVKRLRGYGYEVSELVDGVLQPLGDVPRNTSRTHVLARRPEQVL